MFFLVFAFSVIKQKGLTLPFLKAYNSLNKTPISSNPPTKGSAIINEMQASQLASQRDQKTFALEQSPSLK